jgi:hypothetical protein
MNGSYGDEETFRFNWSDSRPAKRKSFMFKRNSVLVRRTIIISCHACRPCRYSFPVDKDVFVISTARHGYHTATPPVRPTPQTQPSYEVVNVSNTVAKNVFKAKTVGEVISGMLESIPSSTNIGPLNAFDKNTRVVVKARADIGKTMQIPDSLLFVRGFELPSNDEGIFLVDKANGKLSDITTEYGLMEVVDRQRNKRSRQDEQSERNYAKLIEINMQKLGYLEKIKATIDEQKYDKYKDNITKEIDSLKILLANKVANGKYIHGTVRSNPNPYLSEQAGTPQYVRLQDILNHSSTLPGDVFIIVACSSICGSSSKIPGGNAAHRAQQCLVDPMLRTKSVSDEDNVSKKIISGQGAPHSEGEEEEFEKEEQEEEEEGKRRKVEQGGNLNRRKSGSKKKRARAARAVTKRNRQKRRRGTRNKNNKRRKNK